MGNINVICQNCGVGLEIEDDVTSFDCPNCGARLHTNFQEIEDTETDYQDHVARNRSVQSQRKGHGSIVAIILAVIFFAGVGVYLWFHPPILPTPPTPSIAVRWPLKYKEAKKMSYKELKSLLEELGFTNVKGKTEEIPSMNIRRFKSGQIKEISIYTVERTYQNNEIKEDQALPPNAKIEIIYFK